MCSTACSTTTRFFFVQMPNIVGAWWLPPQTASIFRAEFLRPAPDRFIRDDDASFQHLFHQAQAQRKSNIQPDRMSNDSGRKTMTFVADRGLDHDC